MSLAHRTRRILCAFAARGRAAQPALGRRTLPKLAPFVPRLAFSSATQASNSQHVYDVSDSTWHRLVVEESHKVPVILDAWAEWCRPCRVLGPVLEQVVAESGGQVKLAKLDVDQNNDTAAELSVTAIPAVFAFSKGQVIDKFVGGLPAHQVKQFIDGVVKMHNSSK